MDHKWYWLGKINGAVTSLVSWVALLGLLSAVMGWVVSHIALISQYGWAAVVVAGIGIACVILLAASAALVAWRYFHPLSEHRLNKGDDGKRRALAMTLNMFQFLTESRNDRGVYKLSLTFKATQTIAITRVVARFNRIGGNDSYQLASYNPARQMLLGEVFDLVLIHHRPNVGTFWGDVDRITEKKTLDNLSKDESDEYVKRYLLFTGYYFCQIVVQLANGEEENFNFTVLIPAGGERPCVFTGGEGHEDYDPDRHIQGLQGYGAG